MRKSGGRQGKQLSELISHAKQKCRSREIYTTHFTSTTHSAHHILSARSGFQKCSWRVKNLWGKKEEEKIKSEKLWNLIEKHHSKLRRKIQKIHKKKNNVKFSWKIYFLSRKNRNLFMVEKNYQEFEAEADLKHLSGVKKVSGNYQDMEIFFLCFICLLLICFSFSWNWKGRGLVQVFHHKEEKTTKKRVKITFYCHPLPSPPSKISRTLLNIKKQNNNFPFVGFYTIIFSRLWQ